MGRVVPPDTAAASESPSSISKFGLGVAGQLNIGCDLRISSWVPPDGLAWCHGASKGEALLPAVDLSNFCAGMYISKPRRTCLGIFDWTRAITCELHLTRSISLLPIQDCESCSMCTKMGQAFGRRGPFTDFRSRCCKKLEVLGLTAASSANISAAKKPGDPIKYGDTISYPRPRPATHFTHDYLVQTNDFTSEFPIGFDPCSFGGCVCPIHIDLVDERGSVLVGLRPRYRPGRRYRVADFNVDWFTVSNLHKLLVKILALICGRPLSSISRLEDDCRERLIRVYKSAMSTPARQLQILSTEYRTRKLFQNAPQSRHAVMARTPRFDPYERLIYRFYEAIYLLSLLGHTRGPHVATIFDPSSLIAVRRRFFKNLALLCDNLKGGESTASIAVQDRHDCFVFWVSSNEGPSDSVLVFLRTVLQDIKDFVRSTQDDGTDVENDLIRKCVQFSQRRMRSQARSLVNCARRCRFHLLENRTDNQSENPAHAGSLP